MSEKTKGCPCQSGLDYQQCCEPFHLLQHFPSTAEALMRSRYSAYVLGRVDYIVATTVPRQQKFLDVEGIRQWSETTKWAGLTVLRHQPYISKQHSVVAFCVAFLNEETNEVEQYNETSLFVNIEDRWYFVDHTLPLPQAKQNCLCESKKPFKRCCGAYL